MVFTKITVLSHKDVGKVLVNNKAQNDMEENQESVTTAC